MDTYTRAYMAATMPSCETLSSIGSAAANWARTDDDEAESEFAKYSCTDPLAESILATQGIVAYEKYISESKSAKPPTAKRPPDNVPDEKSAGQKSGR